MKRKVFWTRPIFLEGVWVLANKHFTYFFGVLLESKCSHAVRWPEKLETVAPAGCWNWGEWGFKEYKWKVSFLGWFVGLIVPWQEIFVCLGCSSRPSTKYFFSSSYTFSIPVSQSPSKLGGQPCWVACLLVCVSGGDCGVARDHILWCDVEAQSPFFAGSYFFPSVVPVLKEDPNCVDPLGV